MIGQVSRSANRCKYVFFLFLCITGCEHRSSRSGNDAKIEEEYDVSPFFDDMTNLWVYQEVDEFPTYDGKPWREGVFKDFNQRFSYHLQEDKDIPSSLDFQFVVDNGGCLVGARIRGKTEDELTDFEREGLATLISCQNWASGRKDGNAVNVLLSARLIVDFR